MNKVQSGGPSAVLYQLNDGKDLTDLRDSKVGELIKERVPKNTFEEINVFTLQHTFEGQTEPTRSRKITLKRATTSVVVESLRAFLMTFFGDQEAERARYQGSSNLPLIKDRLLGNDYSKNSEEEITKAYVACQIITLTVSNDCNFAEIKMDQSEILIVARRVAGVVDFFIKNAAASAAALVPLVVNLSTRV